MHTLGMKPLLKVTFCVIIAWAIPFDFKKVFVIVGLVGELSYVLRIENLPELENS